jgi:hypothetical protein
MRKMLVRLQPTRPDKPNSLNEQSKLVSVFSVPIGLLVAISARMIGVGCPATSIERTFIMNTTKLMAATIVIALIGVPTVSFAKARGGGFGGGYSGGSRGYSGSESMGSRGSRTYDQNGAKPIEQSTTPRPSATPPPSAAGGPTAQPAPAMQPSFMQRNPLLAGLAAGVMGSYIGHMLFGATESSARTTDAGEAVAETNKPAEGFGSTGILLILMLLGAGAFYYFMKVRRSPTPDFSGITRSSTFSGSLAAEPSATTLSTATVDDEVTSADKAAFQQLLIDVQTAWSKQDLADCGGSSHRKCCRISVPRWPSRPALTSQIMWKMWCFYVQRSKKHGPKTRYVTHDRASLECP